MRKEVVIFCTLIGYILSLQETVNVLKASEDREDKVNEDIQI